MARFISPQHAFKKKQPGTFGMYVLTDEHDVVTSRMAWDSKWEAQRHRKKTKTGKNCKVAHRYVR